MNPIELFLHPPDAFRPVPFWFLNHRLEKEELLRQIEEFQQQGMGGFILHARHGLLTPYLSNEWMQLIQLCAREGHRRGMQVWLYDEDNWPSGTAGGAVTDAEPSFRQTTLVLAQTIATAPGRSIRLKADEDIAYVLGITGAGECRNLSDWPRNGVIEDVPPEIVQILVFAKKVFRGGFHGYYLDTLNPQAVEAFVNATHRRYREFLGEDAGIIAGVFTDEPRFGVLAANEIPWTAALPQRFKRLYDYDIEYALPSLVLAGEGEAAAHRCRFLQCVTDMYCEAYFQTVRAACQEAGWLSIGHPECEGEPARQAWTQGDYFRTAEYWDYAGCDALFDSAWPRAGFCNNLLACKSASSAAHWLGKPRTMSEAFGVAGGWRLSLADIDRLAAFQMALGINFFVPHAAYYSIEGFRKWECPPAHSYQQTFWPWYGRFAERLARLSAMLSQGGHIAAALVLYPMRSFWGLFSLSADDRQRAGQWENAFSIFCETLLRHHYDFDFIAEDWALHLQGDGEGAILYAPSGDARKRYSILLIPLCRVVLSKTVDILERLAQQGTKILFAECLPDASQEQGSDASIRERIERLIEEKENVLFAKGDWLEVLRRLAEPGVSMEGDSEDVIHHHRILPEGDLFFAHNVSTTADYAGKIVFPTAAQYVYEGDAETGRFHRLPVSGPDPTLQVRLQPGESRLFLMNCQPLDGAEAKNEPCGEPLHTIKFHNEYFFFVQMGNELPLHQWRMEIKPFREEPTGWLGLERVYTASFWVDRFNGPLTLICDGLAHQEVFGGKGRQTFAIAINGIPVEKSVECEGFDRLLTAFDASEHIRRGENILTVSSAAHFHDAGHIAEMLSLHGDFALIECEGQQVITQPSMKIKTGSWADQGYPFYSGAGIYRQNLCITEALAEHRFFLQFEKVADLVEIAINGELAGTLWRPPWRMEVTSKVRIGENLFEFRAVNSLANRLMRQAAPSGILGEVKLEIYE
ncbi:MAG: glycosyl hydrolase [Candidatus Omnitrophota bacterium]